MDKRKTSKVSKFQEITYSSFQGDLKNNSFKITLFKERIHKIFLSKTQETMRLRTQNFDPFRSSKPDWEYFNVRCREA